MSHVTEDSGIHTMSSRRESAFGDSTAPNVYNQTKATNDCDAFCGYIHSRCHNNSVEQLSNRFQNMDIPSKHQSNFNCTSNSCSRHDTLSVFSQPGSACESHARSSCYQESGKLNHFSQRCFSDPGGNSFTYQRLQSGSGCCETPHSTCAYANRNCYNSHNENRCLQPISRSNTPASVKQFVGVQSASFKSQTEDQTTKHAEVKSKENGLQQLSSKRLLPTRHQTKNAIVSILDTHEVCIEFIKKRGRIKKEMVCEVCRISPDGLRIILYEPEGGRGVPPSDSPPPLPILGTDQIFSFENLPAVHWKKYMYASKFVNLVKAKTAKITYYTDKTKCQLMENLTDFEACFYEGECDFKFIVPLLE